MRTWKILHWKDRPEHTTTVAFNCPSCGMESNIEVGGKPMAQIGAGIIFDLGGHSMPDAIECPHCRRRKELDQ